MTAISVSYTHLYGTMHRWLEEYSHRITLRPDVFAAIFILMMIIMPVSYTHLIRQPVYDFDNPVLEFHQFHRYQCEPSGIRPVRQLVDVVGFARQLTDSVRILPVQPGRYLC